MHGMHGLCCDLHLCRVRICVTYSTRRGTQGVLEGHLVPKSNPSINDDSRYVRVQWFQSINPRRLGIVLLIVFDERAVAAVPAA
jgi:hypothetical protein